MKIGISTLGIPGEHHGLGPYVRDLVRALAPHTRHHRFTLLVLESDRPAFLFAGDHMNIVTVPEPFRASALNLNWQQGLPGLARKLELDVLHTPGYRRMLWSKPCALVTTLEDLTPLRAADDAGGRDGFYARRVAPVLARRQDELIALSEAAAGDARRRYGLSAQQVTVIHGGVDHRRFRPANSREQAADEVSERFGLDQPFFLHLSPPDFVADDQVRLIQAFNQFKVRTRSPWLLALAGEEKDHEKAVRSAMLHSVHCNDIRSLGSVRDSDLPLLYQAAGAFVCPSLAPGLSLRPLEAMACGCAVLCSPNGSLGELVADAAATADLDDIGTWAAQMTRLATEPESLRLWRNAALARGRHFNLDRAVLTTLRVYQRAFDRSKGHCVGPAVEDVLSALPA